MLKNTFCHLQGVGQRKESYLWRRNVLTWEDFLRRQNLPVSAASVLSSKEEIRRSLRRLKERDAAYFAGLLPPGELWRLFPDFRSSTAYLDIETNGLMGPRGYITAIALYDGKEVYRYVRGRNLEDFRDDIGKYKLLVTYNGKCFDIPFIEADLGVRLDQAHIDLMHLLRGLGFKGGLKGCERALGIFRDELDGLDGYFAVLLWGEYQRTGCGKVLETLLAYNTLDAVNLERLLIHSYNLKLKETPFFGSQRMPLKEPPEPDCGPDAATIERILLRNPWYGPRLVRKYRSL